MSSFAEKKAMKLSKEEAASFIKYNQRQFSRIYPAGSRVDSSNYDPVPLWNIGSQLGMYLVRPEITYDVDKTEVTNKLQKSTMFQI